jgi:hypothetical protein
MLKKLEAWLLAHPAIIHLMDGLFVAVGVAEVAYLKPLLAGGTMPTMNVLLAGLGGAAFLAAKLYVQTTISSNQGQLIAWFQDVMGQAGQQTAAGASPAPSLNVPRPASAALTPLKAVLFLLGFSLLAGPSFAGYLISDNKSEKVGLSLPSGTAIYLLPIEGFDVGIGLPKPTYGLSLNEDLVLGTMATVNGATNLAPIVGVGASLYLDGAGVINGNGPLELLGGLNVVGPDLDLLGMGNGQGLVPNALFTKNFATGECKVTGGLTVFLNLGPGTAKKL